MLVIYWVRYTCLWGSVTTLGRERSHLELSLPRAAVCVDGCKHVLVCTLYVTFKQLAKTIALNDRHAPSNQEEPCHVI